MNDQLIRTVSVFYNLARFLRGKSNPEGNFYSCVGFKENDTGIVPKAYDLQNINPDNYLKYFAYLIGVHEIDWALLIAEMDVCVEYNRTGSMENEEFEKFNFEQKGEENMVGILFNREGAQIRFTSSLSSCFKLASKYTVIKADPIDIVSDIDAFIEQYKGSDIGWKVENIDNDAYSNIPNWAGFSKLVEQATEHTHKSEGVVEWNDWN